MGIGEFFADLPPWLGSVPAWITASSIATYLGLWIKRELGLKRLDVAAEEVRIQAKKLANEDDEILMGHWEREVGALRDKLNGQEQRFQDAMAAQDKRHNDALLAIEGRHSRIMAANEERQARCEQERERLADRVRGLEDHMAKQEMAHSEELRGLRSQIRMNSADQLRLLAASDEPVPPYALEAARRIVAKERKG